MNKSIRTVRRVPALPDDWESLERVFRAFPSRREERFAWRTACALVYQKLLVQGHMGLPALIPGLVHARLATALLAAGYRTKRQLAGRSLLCLGCHAGLEVRILRDFGARAEGLEIRQDVVEAAVNACLVQRGEVEAADYWEYLSQPPRALRHDIFMLAPEEVPVETLWNAAKSHLTAKGHLVIVAQPSDMVGVPTVAERGVALEGTMQWCRLTAED